MRIVIICDFTLIKLIYHVGDHFYDYRYTKAANVRNANIDN